MVSKFKVFVTNFQVVHIFKQHRSKGVLVGVQILCVLPCSCSKDTEKGLLVWAIRKIKEIKGKVCIFPDQRSMEGNSKQNSFEIQQF
jgi:hypothetical protein